MVNFPPVVLFENTDIIVINKRPDIPVIPGRGIAEGSTLIEMVNVLVGTSCMVVHRLDKATSGAIVFAKNAKIHRDINIQFEKRLVIKQYHALVSGKVEREGLVDKPIREFGSGRMGIDPNGKESVTKYNIIKNFNNSTLLDVSPRTGRRHQIRVHLYSIGYPVFGDTVYGKDRPVGGVSRLMLHAYSITLDLPGIGAATFTAPHSVEWNEIISNIK